MIYTCLVLFINKITLNLVNLKIFYRLIVKAFLQTTIAEVYKNPPSLD